METYFSKLPIIEYDGVTTRNITERVVMVTTPRMVPTNYYPYELKNNLRADQLAGNYYQDPNLDWMIYTVNNIVDPYYGWHLYEEDFEEFIIKKYGGIDYSQQLIAFYRNNWYDHLDEVTVSYYLAMTPDHKKYYEPVWGSAQKIKGYRRREWDWTMSTNRIEQWQITQSANAISNNQLLVIRDGDGFDVGWAYAVMTNSSVMLVKHIIGNNTPTNTIREWSNNANWATINSVTVLQTSIPDTEAVFWEPVSYYDVEREANENKRFIELLDSGFALETSEEIRKALVKKND